MGNGSLVNGVAWNTDPVRGSVLSFDGSNDYVVTGNLPQARVNGDITYSFWTRLATTGSGDNDVVVGNRFGGPSSQFTKFTPTRYERSVGGTLDYTNLTRTDPPTGGNWVHSLLVKSGSSFSYYRDGVLDTSGTNAANFAGDMPFFIGGDSGGENVAGLIDDVGIFDAALDVAQVGAIYNLASEPGLQYNLGQANSLLELYEGGSGTVEIDGVVWEFQSGLSGGLGQVVLNGDGVFELQLSAGGLGVAQQIPLSPEPASFALCGILMAIGLGRYFWQRKRHA